MMKKTILTRILLGLITIIGLISCSSMPNSRMTTSPSLPMSSLWRGDQTTIWNKLQTIPPSKLAILQNQTSDPTQAAWLQLALISKRNSVDTQRLASELIAWRNQHPNHPGNQLLPDNDKLNRLQNLSQPQRIALLLPQSGGYGSSGQTVREGFLNAYYTSPQKTGKQSVKFYDTAQTKDMQTLYQQAIAEGADFVIGPLTKEHVQQLSKSSSFNSPTLALNYTETGSLPTNFYQFGLLPEDEISQMSERAREHGASRAIVIAPQNAWGSRLATAFATHWQASGGSVQQTWSYSAHTDFNKEIARLLNIDLTIDKKLMKEKSNRAVLSQQRRRDFDVIFLFAQSQQARIIVPLLRYYYAGDVPIYAASSAYGGKPDRSKDVDLKGIIVCDIPGSKVQNGGQISTDRLYAVGQDAYLLSQTLQRLAYLPKFPIYGTTGALTLASNQQIHRRLPCVAIKNGLV